MAISVGRLDLVRLLLDYGANVDISGYSGSPIHVATERSLEMLQLLCEKGADLRAKNLRGQTAFEITCQLDDTSKAKYLLKWRATFKGPDNEILPSALQIASKHHKAEVVKLLISEGADVNSPGPHGTALQVAASFQDPSAISVVEILVKAGADVNAPGPRGTALQLARCSGNVKVVRFLESEAAKQMHRTGNEGSYIGE